MVRRKKTTNKHAEIAAQEAARKVTESRINLLLMTLKIMQRNLTLI